jgi:hypothetical protein
MAEAAAQAPRIVWTIRFESQERASEHFFTMCVRDLEPEAATRR